MQEVRCKKCKRLLMIVEPPIKAEIKCSKCNTLNKIDVEHHKRASQDQE